VRGRTALFPKILHPGRSGSAIRAQGKDNVVQLARSEFLYVTRRTRGSRGEQLSEHQKRQGSLWSQHNLYRDVIEPAREAAGVTFTLYDARHTFVSTLMAAGVPLPEVAAYTGHSVGELASVAAGDGRLRSQTTLAVYTHATGQARELALRAVGSYLDEMLERTVAPGIYRRGSRYVVVYRSRVVSASSTPARWPRRGPSRSSATARRGHCAAARRCTGSASRGLTATPAAGTTACAPTRAASTVACWATSR
jgi:hypothetical protein